MNGKSFFLYSFFGLIALAIGWGIWSDNIDRLGYSPEYLGYEAQVARYNEQAGDRENLQRRIAFERVIAGLDKPESLPNREAQELAAAAHDLGAANLDPSRRAEAIKTLHFDMTDRSVRDIHSCAKSDGNGNKSDCQFEEPYTVLNDPLKLAALWNPDKALAAKAISTPSALLVDRPVFPSGVPQYRHDRLTAWLIAWGFYSLAFALGFFLGGIAVHYGSIDDYTHKTDWSQPLRSLPRFAFGWLALLAALPGYLTVRLVHGLLVLLFVDAVSGIAKMKDKMLPRSFSNEYERLVAQLAKIREKEIVQRRPELVREIDSALERVRISEDLAELQQIRESIRGAEAYAEALQEVDRIGRP